MSKSTIFKSTSLRGKKKKNAKGVSKVADDSETKFLSDLQRLDIISRSTILTWAMTFDYDYFKNHNQFQGFQGNKAMPVPHMESHTAPVSSHRPVAPGCVHCPLLFNCMASPFVQICSTDYSTGCQRATCSRHAGSRTIPQEQFPHYCGNITRRCTYLTPAE